LSSETIGPDLGAKTQTTSLKNTVWRVIGERARVTAGNEIARIHHGGREVTVHAELNGRHGRVVDNTHLAGIVETRERPIHLALPRSPPVPTALLRPLAEYEAVVGGLLVDDQDHLTALLSRLKLRRCAISSTA